MKRPPVDLDLGAIRTELKVWRANRQGKERIPEKYWEAAIALLEHYPFQKVRKELNLNTKQLKQRAEAKGIKTTQRQYKERNAVPHSRSKSQAFLKVSAGDLINNLPIADPASLSKGREQTCRIVFERADGSRLSLSLPIEVNLIQSICNGFIKA